MRPTLLLLALLTAPSVSVPTRKEAQVIRSDAAGWAPIDWHPSSGVGCSAKVLEYKVHEGFGNQMRMLRRAAMTAHWVNRSVLTQGFLGHHTWHQWKQPETGKVERKQNFLQVGWDKTGWVFPHVALDRIFDSRGPIIIDSASCSAPNAATGGGRVSGIHCTKWTRGLPIMDRKRWITQCDLRVSQFMGKLFKDLPPPIHIPIQKKASKAAAKDLLAQENRAHHTTMRAAVKSGKYPVVGFSVSTSSTVFEPPKFDADGKVMPIPDHSAWFLASRTAPFKDQGTMVGKASAMDALLFRFDVNDSYKYFSAEYLAYSKRLVYIYSHTLWREPCKLAKQMRPFVATHVRAGDAKYKGLLKQPDAKYNAKFKEQGKGVQQFIEQHAKDGKNATVLFLADVDMKTVHSKILTRPPWSHLLNKSGPDLQVETTAVHDREVWDINSSKSKHVFAKWKRIEQAVRRMEIDIGLMAEPPVDIANPETPSEPCTANCEARYNLLNTSGKAGVDIPNRICRSQTSGETCAACLFKSQVHCGMWTYRTPFSPLARMLMDIMLAALADNFYPHKESSFSGHIDNLRLLGALREPTSHHALYEEVCTHG